MFEKTGRLIDEAGIEIAFLIGLIATAGSLFTSQILKWSPCTLCLYQRVFMYPLVLILGIAVLWRNIWLRRVALSLAVAGAPISLYHHLLVRFDPTQGCGLAIPCSMGYQFNLDFFVLRPMHVPLSAFIAFMAIALVLGFKEFIYSKEH